MCHQSDPNSDEKIPIDEHPQNNNGIYMEEALASTNFGKFNYILILIGGSILGAVFLETCGISMIMPVFHSDLELSDQQKGVLGGASFVGIICSSHLWGYLADTKGRKCIIQPTLMIAFALSVLSTFTNNFYVIVTLRFLNGFFISGSSATIYAYLGEFHANSYRSRAIMGSALIFGFICLLLPTKAFFIINQDWQFSISILGIVYRPWRLFLIACSLPGFLASLALFSIPESPKFVLSQGNQKKTIEILKQMHRWNNGKNAQFDIKEIFEEAESIENRNRIQNYKENRFPLISSVWGQTAPLFKSPYLRSTILVCATQFGIYAVCNGFYMFFAEILNRMANSLDSFIDDRIEMCDVIRMQRSNLTNSDKLIRPTKLQMSTLEHCFILETLYVTGYTFINLLINRFGKFNIIFVILGMSGIGGISAMLTEIPIIQIGSFIALMCGGIAGNVISAAIVEIYPTSCRAMAICIALMFARIGAVFGSNGVAYFSNNYCEATFYTAAGITLSSLIPNIHRKVSKSKGEHRISIISARG